MNLDINPCNCFYSATAISILKFKIIIVIINVKQKHTCLVPPHLTDLSTLPGKIHDYTFFHLLKTLQNSSNNTAHQLSVCKSIQVVSSYINIKYSILNIVCTK